MFWLDWAIIVFILLGAWQGFLRGIMAQLFQIVSLILAIFIAITTFPAVGSFLETQLKLPISYARPLALAGIFFVAGFVLHFLSNILHKLLAPILQANILNRAGGAIVGALRNLLTASIVLALVITLPTPSSVKAGLEKTKLAKPLITLALSLERSLGKLVGDDTLKSLSYRIVPSDETTTTALNYTVADPKVDLAGESELLLITNQVRDKAGVPTLKPHLGLRDVAYSHGRDMLAKGYFSHLSPQGKDALVRVRDAKIDVLAVGENLANAPTVEIAQAGLLGSTGHRQNILNKEFNVVGIAVLDAGSHGKMIVEVFAKIP
jgi:uncharacterized protein YkwD